MLKPEFEHYRNLKSILDYTIVTSSFLVGFFFEIMTLILGAAATETFQISHYHCSFLYFKLLISVPDKLQLYD